MIHLEITSHHLVMLSFQCETIDPADVTALATNVKRALATCGTPVQKEMIENCMAQDLSWKVRLKTISRLLLADPVHSI